MEEFNKRWKGDNDKEVTQSEVYFCLIWYHLSHVVTKIWPLNEFVGFFVVLQAT